MREDKQTITTTYIETPLGNMIAGATSQAVCLLEFSDRRSLSTQLKSLTKLLNADTTEGNNEHLDLLRCQLKEYFEGKRKEFTVPLISPGTAFQQTVWNELLKIPYGSTRSYKQQAIAINNIDAIRAVAHSNGLNRISIIIPCHRIIGEDGNLTGYGGGLWRKKWLLEFEKGQKNLFH